MPRRKKTFGSELGRCLVVIDKGLNGNGTPLQSRPLRAATLFVKEFIEIRGDTKERYYGKPWFALIFAEVLKWYREKYGAAMEKRDKGFPSAILIHGVPFNISVPLTHSEVDVPGQTTWLSFETKVGHREDPRSWIDSPPTLETLSTRASIRLDQDLFGLTSSIRTINLNLRTATVSSPAFDEMRNIVLLSLASAAQHICEASRFSLPLAIWDLNYALENAMKCLVMQGGNDFPHVHDLDLLLKESSKVGKRPFSRNSLRFLPKDKRLIAHRYGTALPGGLVSAHAAYVKTLERLVRIVQKLDCECDFSRARVLLKRPPWFDQLPEFRDLLKQNDVP